MSCNPVMKYLILALAVAGALKYSGSFNLSNQQIIMVVVASVVGLYTYEVMTQGTVLEMMEDGGSFPAPYTQPYLDEDYGNTGLRYDNNTPQYMGPDSNYILVAPKDGDEITLQNIADKINASKARQLIAQSSAGFGEAPYPHTHQGKARGYLNWKPVPNVWRSKAGSQF